MMIEICRKFFLCQFTRFDKFTIFANFFLLFATEIKFQLMERKFEKLRGILESVFLFLLRYFFRFVIFYDHLFHQICFVIFGYYTFGIL